MNKINGAYIKVQIFISEFENKESLCNVMSETYKSGDAKKASSKRLPELSEMSGN